ncbi:MAG: hypothetical protein IT168_28950 [Bryobacterales bacterium]|nr:hypothetical protein [Bryobacterales bacterium]
MQSRKRSAQSSGDTVEATPSANQTPRVGVILSSFAGGEDHFGGVKFAALPEPKPVTAELTDAQVEAMTRRAIELGTDSQGGLPRWIQRDQDVVVLVDKDADPAVVSTVATIINDRKPQSLRIVTDAATPFAAAECVNPATAESMVMPAPGIFSRRDVSYKVPKIVLHCDRLITVGPLRVRTGRPLMSIDTFRVVAKPVTPAAGTPDVIALDGFGFHVPEYAVVGGRKAFRDGKAIVHNVVIAGTIPAAVDAVAAAVMGLKPDTVPLLQLARKRGYGDPDLDTIWIRGNEVDEARLKATV